VEPERLYSLRSSNMEEPPKRSDSSSSSGDKWRKCGVLGPSPKRVGPSPNPYRPGSSSSPSPVRRSTLDRAIPRPIDSYRPPVAPRQNFVAPLTRSTSSSNMVLTRSTAMNNNTAPVKNEMSSSSSDVPRRPTSLSNSAQHHQQPTVSSNSRADSATIVYLSQEKYMEKKAMALGLRREFFQYLQKKRVSLLIAQMTGTIRVPDVLTSDSL
jgi:hypothetical protein